MQTTHYLKREKEGKLIQLWMITELYDEIGYHKNAVKFDIDPNYKSVFSYLQYPIPHEELTEINFDEFRELCGKYNCLTKKPTPAPLAHACIPSNC